MNKQDLISKIKQLDGISQDERAYLINLVNTKKKYGLVWEDKPEDVEEELRENLPVLKEVKEKAIVNGEDNPNHILIEGDNLHALTALTFTHEGKIDVIYIDPPYNTGNKDFKYNDTFVDKEDSYRHSKWLSFMDKRLRIAKRLLSETGVIFMSIDDNENAQLKLLCDEIFYEKNLISDVIWQSRKSVSNDTFISLNHNYTLIYAKDISYLDKNNFRLPTSVEKFDNSDNDPRGPWVADPFDAPNLRPNLTYAIINPNNGKEFWPPKGRCWRTGEDEYLKFLADNRIVFGKKGETKPQLKRFLDFAVDKGATSISIWSDIETTTNGTQQLEDILGSKLFTNPKPLGLLDRILKLSTNNNKTANVLDFFAGSGTTLHATMALNAADGSNRQCILVTNNENNICEEVTYERNKRVIQGYTNAKGVAVAALDNNNLRYFKSEYVSRETSLKNKRELTYLATELLCIKEDCYTEKTIAIKDAKLFVNNKVALLVLFDDHIIPDAIEFIKSFDGPKIKVYVFSIGSDPYTEDFTEVLDKIELCALPDAIYKAYQNVLPKRKRPEKLIDLETENPINENGEQLSIL
jgi:adenine-specific DNA-methyltransferase